jgi:hypothetical protein
MATFRPSRVSGAIGISLAIANLPDTGPVLAVSVGASPTVKLFAPEGQPAFGFDAFDGNGFGVTLAAVDWNGDGHDEIAAAPTAGINRVRIIDPISHSILVRFEAGTTVDPAAGLRIAALRGKASAADSLLVANGPGSPVAVLAIDDLSGEPVNLAPDIPHRAFGIFVG